MASIAPKFNWQTAVASSDLSPTTRHVAWAVSMYVNHMTNTAWPGATRLARDTGLHISTVRERLAELVEKGWLVKEVQGGHVDGRPVANTYSLSTPLAHGDPSPVATHRQERTDPSPTATHPLASGDPNQERTKKNKNSSSTGGLTDSYEECFNRWWEDYPRKVGRAKAFNAYKARRREGVSHDRLVTARDKYALSRLGEPDQFTMHGSTFLAKEGPWSEWELEAPPEKEPESELGVWAEPRLVLPPARVDVCPVCESSMLACVCPKEESA